MDLNSENFMYNNSARLPKMLLIFHVLMPLFGKVIYNKIIY